MLQRLFVALKNFPSHSQSPPHLYYIFNPLWIASGHSATPLSRKVAREVVVQGIPAVLRKTKSISLALALGQGAVHLHWDHFDLDERPFITAHKVMLEIWSEQEGVEGRTEENLSKWKELRSDAMGWKNVNLADLNGPLPTWHPSAPRTGPSKLDRLLSVFGIDRVCASYTSLHFALLISIY